MQTILTQDAQTEIKEKYHDRKYEYKVNSSLSLGFIRKKLLTMFSKKNDSEKIMEELKELFIKNLVPIRLGRSYERIPDKYRQRKRPKQFNNRRNVL